MKAEINHNSILSFGLPPERGRPVHVEHDDGTAATLIVGNRVHEIHTPQDAFRRVHEYMHAMHSDDKLMKRRYRRVDFMVRQVTEDCLIHLKHWPWRFTYTPSIIATSTKDYLAKEMRELNASIKKQPNLRGSFADFAVRLRQVAIKRGMFGGSHISTASFADGSQIDLAKNLLILIKKGKVRLAAEMLHNAFFDPLPREEATEDEVKQKEKDDDGEPGGDDDEDYDDGGYSNPVMTIHELPHTVRTTEAKLGTRRARNGPRLHRPSLRKPILPQRLFVKRARQEPGGTVLIDASGSMGDWDEVSQWVEKAPYATVAYYAGDETTGQLFVYARGGRHAVEMPHPDYGGNTVDGPALDWLMSQKGPRLFITDREFCGASDSLAQIERLKRLERTGQVKVENYSS